MNQKFEKSKNLKWKTHGIEAAISSPYRGPQTV